MLAYGGVGVALHLLKPPQIVLDGLVLLILGLVLLLKPRLLLFPRMSRDFTSRGTVLVQLSAGHVERPQLVLMLPLEFFPFTLPLDTLQLVIDGLGVPVEGGEAKQFLQFVQTGGLGFHGCADGLRPFTLGGDMGLQIFQSGDTPLGQKIDGLGKVFEVSNLGVAAPCSGVPALIVVSQQGGEVGGLGLAQFLLCRLYPVGQVSDFPPNIPQQVIGLSYPAVEIAFVGGDAFGLHLADGHALMDGGQ